MRLLEKLVLFSLLPFFAVAVGIILLLHDESTSRIFELSRKTSMVTLQLQERILNAHIERHQLLLEAVVIAPPVVNGFSSDTASYLRRIETEVDTEIDGLYFVDINGDARGTQGEAFNIRDRPSFRDIAAGKATMGQAVRNRGTGNLVIPIYAPIRTARGELIGAVGCGIRVKGLTEFATKLKLTYEGRLVIMDRSGLILAAGDFSPGVLAEYQRQFQAHAVPASRMANLGQKAWLVESMTTRPLGLHLAILRPSDALTAEIERDTRRVLVISLVGVLTALFLAMVASLQLLRPLAVLREQFAALASGDMTARVPETRNDELGDIGQWFNQTSIVLEENERKLRLANEALEIRVAERTAELEAFTYSLSHDVRSYLRAVSGHAGMIEEDYGEQIGTEGREHITRIQEAIRRMSNVLEGLQRLAHLSQVRRIIEPVDLAALARDVAGELRSDANRPSVIFEAPPQLMVEADREMMRVLLQNILGNAWKFSRDADNPTVQMTSQATPNGIEVRIADNGIGVKPDDRERIFLPFTRTASGRAFVGDGIGLAIVSRIATRHGGHAWAEAASTGGTVIAFSLQKPTMPPDSQEMN